MVATDGYRLAYCAKPTGYLLPKREAADVLVPLKTLNAVSKYIDAAPKGTMVKLSLTDNHVFFEMQGSDHLSLVNRAIPELGIGVAQKQPAQN